MKEVSAGGVVFKKNKDQIQMMLIEDRFSRVTFPKGRQESGETIKQTALREIREETGVEGQILQSLEVIYYQYGHPVHGTMDKEVHYFLVEAVSGTLTPQLEEINKVQWYSPDEALRLQEERGYDNNLTTLKMAYQELGLKALI